MVCPAATKISIQLVQYGRLTPDDGLCPANIRYPGPRASITGAEDRHQQVEILILDLELVWCGVVGSSLTALV